MASRAKSRTLTDHDEIRRWAEERGARPSAVRRTHSDDNTGIIRLDFPGYSGADSLEEISWDEWLQDFDDRNLALIVQDETADGEQSNFNKLVSRESVEGGSEGTSSKKRGSSSRKAATRRSASATAQKKRSRSSATTSSKSSSSKSRSGQERKTTERSRTSRRKAA